MVDRLNKIVEKFDQSVRLVKKMMAKIFEKQKG